MFCNTMHCKTIQKYREKIQDKIVPKYVMDVIDEELDCLTYLSSKSREYECNFILNLKNARIYLDWITSMLWGVKSTEQLDVQEAIKCLEQDHSGMTDIKQKILEFIAIEQLKGHFKGKILCLHGPPGVGKTSIAKSISRAMNREYFRFSVGGLRDICEIKGHSRTYIAALPGRIIQCLKTTKTKNPLVLIDEIDKITENRASALLEVLDPEQNTNFLDHFLGVPVDLSDFFFICTANEIDQISAPMHDRMEVVNLRGYFPEEKLAIARDNILYLNRHMIVVSTIAITSASITDDSVLNQLINYYCSESGVRNLKMHIDEVHRKAAYKIVTENIQAVHVTCENLTDFVGKPTSSNELLYSEEISIGVALGLFEIEMGDGCSVFIETTIKQTNNKNKNYDEITGAVHSGVGNTALNKILACCDIPGISNDMYKKYEAIVGSVMEEEAQKSCKRAADEERRLVIKNISKLYQEL